MWRIGQRNAFSEEEEREDRRRGLRTRRVRAIIFSKTGRELLGARGVKGNGDKEKVGAESLGSKRIRNLRLVGRLSVIRKSWRSRGGSGGRTWGKCDGNWGVASGSNRREAKVGQPERTRPEEEEHHK